MKTAALAVTVLSAFAEPIALRRTPDAIVDIRLEAAQWNDTAPTTTAFRHVFRAPAERVGSLQQHKAVAAVERKVRGTRIG